MGNTSSAISGAATIDSYIGELGDVTFEKSLSSSRFLKCVRGRHEDGQVVVKLFVKSGTLDLKKYAKQVQREKDLLFSIPNALSFQSIKETDRAGYLVRQYISSNLYDRISTRPFLESIEKRWIVFQLLSGLRDCHGRGVHHGDIKTENVLVTSWNWVYLTDFAFFKPTYLPENNPADFSYYFDTSFRRTCYLAPERFLESHETKGGAITDAMDIFSLGCVIAELFLEGSPLFDLSQLFKYKAGEYDPMVLLDKIDDLEIRSLIAHMIGLDPDKRYSADEYLIKWRRRAFPNYFTEFLHEYVAMISDPQRHHSHSPSTDIDDELDRIFFEFDKLSFHLGFDDSDAKPNKQNEKVQRVLTTLSIPNYQPIQVGAQKRAGGEDGALIFLSIVLSGIRNTTRSITRVRACDTLLALSERISDEAKLDRVIPYLATLMNDDAPEVRSSAVRAMAQILAMVKVLTPVNAFVFPEYILPRLSPFTNDPSVLVRTTYAQSLALIASTASRYSDMAQALRVEGFLTLVDATETENAPSEEDNFTALFDIGKKDQDRLIHEHVIVFLTDPNEVVKRTLLDSIAQLSAFFGRHKANDVILSHLITYLNDREWLLRASFFKNIVSLSRYLGQDSVEEYIVPLMIQALTDTEDFIIVKVLNSLTDICESKLIRARVSTNIIAIVVRFLVHPNLWIQEAVAGYIAMAAKDLSPADIYCIVYPQVRPFLRNEIVGISAMAILQALRGKLSTQVLEIAFKWAQTVGASGKSQFWLPANIHREFSGDISSKSSAKISVAPLPSMSSTHYKDDRKITHTQKIPVLRSAEDDTYLSKLRAAGLRPEDEWKLLALREYIWRVSHMRNEIEKSASNSRKSCTLSNTPITIFFDTLSQEDVLTVKSRHLASHDVQSVLKDASFNLDNSRARRLPRKTTYHLPQTRSHNPPLSNGTSHISNMLHGDTNHDMLHCNNADDSRNASASSSVNGDTRNLSHRSSSAVNLPGMSSKASAAVSTTNTVALGQLDHLCTVDHAQSSVKRRPIPRASHTYTGTDINILHRLDEVYLDNYPETLDGFGQNVTPTPPAAHAHTGTSNVPWRPEGILVAHIQEHTAAINCIRISPDSVFFLTCSDDGTVKVWDSGRLERNVANRARLTYRGMTGSRIKTICFLENSYCVAAASDHGTIHIVRIDCTTSNSGSTKFGATHAIRKHQFTDGEIAIQMEHFLQDQASILLVATNKCRVVAIDLRSMATVYVLSNPPHHGSLTCFCTDKKKTWLLLGTSRGIMDLWDLRFQLRIKSIGLPHSSRINSLQIRPSRGQGRWVCVATAADAEITVWDIEKSICREIYRPLGDAKSQQQDYQAWEVDESKPEEILARFTDEISISAVEDIDTKPGLRAMAIGQDLLSETNSRTNSIYLLGASTDLKIRVWDVNKIEQSTVISGLTDAEGGEKSSFHAISHGTTVVNEEIESKSTRAQPKRPSRSAALASSQSQLLKNHMDTIMDVAYLQWPYSMVISGDRSGILKVFS